MIAKLKNIPIERNLCIYCQKEFPRGPLAIVSFDIAVAHRERWMYMNRNCTSDTEPLYIPSSSKKLTTNITVFVEIVFMTISLILHYNLLK